MEESRGTSELPRRLSFGRIAESYDSHRPSYHPDLFRWLVSHYDLSASSCILEVGSGTGKATMDLLGIGSELDLVEPSEEMTRILSSKIFGENKVNIFTSDFETIDLGDGGYDLVASGQAWHWVTSGVGSAKASRLLRKGGGLAVFWNRGTISDSSVGEPLADLLEGIDQRPRRSPEGYLIYGPQSREEYLEELEASGLFSEVTSLSFTWNEILQGDEAAALMSTLSEIHTLEPQDEARVLTEISEIVSRSPRGVEVTFETLAYVATK